MLKANIETFLACDASYEEAGIVLYGAPFDSTTSYRPGTRFGSRAIRSESYGLESYSPYQDRDLTDYAVFDAGDQELCFGDASLALKDLRERAAEVAGDGKIPFMLGGEHLVTLAPVQALAEKYPDLHIIHFDAHADLRDDYLGVKESHACVLHRCWDIVGDGKIYQFGIRSGDRDEFKFAKEHTLMEKFGFFRLDSIVKKLQGKPVYFTLDLDVLDPSEFPGTGTPEAGGVTFKELMFAVEEVAKLNIVGFDVNELSPVYDQTGRSTALACKLLREILLYFYK